jgi:hypothetical protein
MSFGMESIVERECRTVTLSASPLAASASRDSLTIASLTSHAYTLSAPDRFTIILHRDLKISSMLNVRVLP